MRQATAGQPAAGQPTAAARLLAEAVHYYEAGGGPADAATEAAALAEARGLAGSLEAKVTVRAGLLPVADELGHELTHLWGLLRGLVLAGVVLAAAAGAATARTALASADGVTVNFFWLLASLLGLHGLSFVVWLVLMVAAPRRGGGGVLGGAVLWLWRQVAERVGGGRARLAAIQALAARWGRGRAGRWLASGLSHGLWCGYLLGAVLMTLVLLSAQRYTFVWETTILDEAAYVWLTDTLAAVPALLGIAVPDRAAIVAARWPGSAQAGHEIAWSSLLIAALVLYGLLPRLLALAASVALARRGTAGDPLDLSQPYYAQLVARLAPMVGATRIVDGAPDGAAPGAAARLAAVPALGDLPPPAPPGPVYLLGWEIDAPATGWPPPATPGGVRDLGCRDGRAELAQAIASVGGGAPGGSAPGRLVVVADLRQTPDRGVTTVFAALKTAARDRLVVLLTGLAAMAERLTAADASTRLADWVAAGQAAGVDLTHMVAIDLDQATDDSRRRLAALLGASS